MPHEYDASTGEQLLGLLSQAPRAEDLALSGASTCPRIPVVRSTLRGATHHKTRPLPHRESGPPRQRDEHGRSRTTYSQQPVTARDSASRSPRAAAWRAAPKRRQIALRPARLGSYNAKFGDTTRSPAPVSLRNCSTSSYFGRVRGMSCGTDSFHAPFHGGRRAIVAWPPRPSRDGHLSSSETRACARGAAAGRSIRGNVAHPEGRCSAWPLAALCSF